MGFRVSGPFRGCSGLNPAGIPRNEFPRLLSGAMKKAETNISRGAIRPFGLFKKTNNKKKTYKAFHSIYLFLNILGHISQVLYL